MEKLIQVLGLSFIVVRKTNHWVSANIVTNEGEIVPHKISSGTLVKVLTDGRFYCLEELKLGKPFKEYAKLPYILIHDSPPATSSSTMTFLTKDQYTPEAYIDVLRYYFSQAENRVFSANLV